MTIRRAGRTAAAVLALLVCAHRGEASGTGTGTGSGGGSGGGSTSHPNAESAVGVNLHRFASYTPEWVFVDAFRMSSSWIPQEANSTVFSTGYPLTLDANGWPILGINPAGNPEAAGKLMFNDLAGHYPSGKYVCFYDGTGSIEFNADATIVKEQPGKILVDVATPTKAGIALKIVSSDPADLVRNIRVVMPGFESTYQTQVFHPRFLETMKHYKVIRFMDVQRTNDSTQMHWVDRTKTSWHSQADNSAGNDRGPAFEFLIQLCNALHAEPWFCIPHMATDTYITKLAKLIRKDLDPELRVWIEYSNEVWNGMFSQKAWCALQGQARGYDVNAGDLAALRFQSARSVEAFQIFENVFGSAERLVRVLSGQLSNPGVGVTVMDWNSAYLHADAYAVAGYFGAPNITIANAPFKTVDDVLADLYNGSDAAMDLVDDNLVEAQARGLELVTYEGGQALLGISLAQQALFEAANRDPGIYSPYLSHFEKWRAHGGHMFMQFTSSSHYDVFGYWGLLEFQDQDVTSSTAAPKWVAVHDFVQANPRWW